MKSTYTAPTVVSRGDVAHLTLGGKASVIENGAFGPNAGSNLSFGL